MIERPDIIERIYKVQDPELGMSIVDLGLLYDVRQPDEKSIHVDLTLTYPGCPLGPMITDDIEEQLKGWKGIEHVKVTIVWEPAWEKTMMEEDILEELKFQGRIR